MNASFTTPREFSVQRRCTEIQTRWVKLRTRKAFSRSLRPGKHGRCPAISVDKKVNAFQSANSWIHREGSERVNDKDFLVSSWTTSQFHRITPTNHSLIVRGKSIGKRALRPRIHRLQKILFVFSVDLLVTHQPPWTMSDERVQEGGE